MLPHRLLLPMLCVVLCFVCTGQAAVTSITSTATTGTTTAETTTNTISLSTQPGFLNARIPPDEFCRPKLHTYTNTLKTGFSFSF